MILRKSFYCNELLKFASNLMPLALGPNIYQQRQTTDHLSILTTYSSINFYNFDFVLISACSLYKSSAALAISSQNFAFGISFLDVMVYCSRSEKHFNSVPPISTLQSAHRRSLSCTQLQSHQEQPEMDGQTDKVKQIYH
jgi:hypothetical protein